MFDSLDRARGRRRERAMPAGSMRTPLTQVLLWCAVILGAGCNNGRVSTGRIDEDAAVEDLTMPGDLPISPGADLAARPDSSAGADLSAQPPPDMGAQPPPDMPA